MGEVIKLTDYVAECPCGSTIFYLIVDDPIKRIVIGAECAECEQYFELLAPSNAAE